MKVPLFLLCLIQTSIIAQSPFVYAEKDQLIPVEKGIVYYIDSSKTMDFETVRHLPDAAYDINTQSVFNFGNNHFPFWLRLDFENRTKEDLYLALGNFELRLADAYLLNKQDSLVKTWHVGVFRPLGNSFFRTPNATFNLGQQPNRLYLRVQTPSMYLPMKLGSIFCRYHKRRELLLIIKIH